MPRPSYGYARRASSEGDAGLAGGAMTESNACLVCPAQTPRVPFSMSCHTAVQYRYAMYTAWTT
ncbi:hypothetical protein E2C01_092084 [Portunus trituberculatus]|uniref:Uncharacterized protein n=1 Tax=Portunus trituberculatus TaxID=210409 RepID=A0A5B7JQF2_PORTR|nr:hypothetical protein [Portunus trituberculatus]